VNVHVVLRYISPRLGQVSEIPLSTHLCIHVIAVLLFILVLIGLREFFFTALSYYLHLWAHVVLERKKSHDAGAN
jgi:hypothetical protein